jgi:hypothetical protein
MRQKYLRSWQGFEGPLVDAVDAEEQYLCHPSDLHVEHTSARLQNQSMGLEASDGPSDKATLLLISCDTD